MLYGGADLVGACKADGRSVVAGNFFPSKFAFASMNTTVEISSLIF